MERTRSRLTWFLLVIFLVGIHMPIYAQEIPTLYRGVRPLGMGGAFTAISDDENALFYNPAGLKDVKGFAGIQVLNPLVEISEESLDLFSDLQDLEGSNLVQVTDFLNERIGEHQHVRVSLFPNILMHNFGLGVLAQGTGDIEVRNPANPQAITDVKLDIGLIGAAALGFGKGFQIGAGAKVVQRSGIKKTFTAVDIAGEQFDPLEDLENELDFAFDVGGMAHLPVLWDPTIGIVVQNITDLDFGTLGEIPQQLNIGVAIHPNFWIIQSVLAFDILDVTKQIGEDDDLNKRVHLGGELRFPKILSLRVGLNQRYITGGITLDFWIIRLDYATYAEEVGVFAGQRPDRRHVAQLSLGF